MAQIKHSVNDPKFSEYMFHVMRMCPSERKKDLNPLELSVFGSEKAMRRFADNETLDRRLLLLSRMGYSYCVVLAPENSNIDPILKKVTAQYRSVESRKAIIEAMAKQQVFIISSHDTLVLAHMAAQNCHSQNYILDYVYLTLHDSMKAAKREVYARDIEDSKSGLEDLARIVQIAIQQESLVVSICGITKFQLQVLLCMYPYRDRMIKNDRISELMGESYRSSGVAKACSELEKGGYVLREPGAREDNRRSKVFMIADKGIDTVLKYLTYITHKTFK